MGKPLTIDILQKFAESKKGKCLSSIYSGWNNIYVWQCEKGHVWKASWRKISSRSCWCTICDNKYRLESIKKIAEYIEKHKGFFLSEYKNCESKYQWRCSKGHTWLATWHAQKTRIFFCKECSLNQRSIAACARVNINKIALIDKQLENALQTLYKSNKELTSFELSKISNISGTTINKRPWLIKQIDKFNLHKNVNNIVLEEQIYSLIEDIYKFCDDANLIFRFTFSKHSIKYLKNNIKLDTIEEPKIKPIISKKKKQTEEERLLALLTNFKEE